MESDKRLLGALRTLFYPLAGALLKSKVGVVPVIHQLKLAFVEAARDKHGRNGRPATTNKIANLTGMSRQHVRDLLDEAEVDPCRDEISLPNESLVLAAWCTKDDYTDKRGLPVPLELGPGKGTLRTLISESTGTNNIASAIENLLETENIFRRDDGRFELAERVFSINRDLPRIISVFLSSMASTVEKNWGRPKSDSFIIRAAHSRRLNHDKIPMIRRIATEELTRLLERVDDELSRNEADEEQPMIDDNGTELSSVGIGVYYFEKDRL
ncbi:MAG: DUF6502 family protein [Woeseiaceae bacterium]|nr:DUF6502 family protein [Woeseiaceae bacterium]